MIHSWQVRVDFFVFLLTIYVMSPKEEERENRGEDRNRKSERKKEKEKRKKVRE